MFLTLTYFDIISGCSVGCGTIKMRAACNKQLTNTSIFVHSNPSNVCSMRINNDVFVVDDHVQDIEVTEPSDITVFELTCINATIYNASVLC